MIQIQAFVLLVVVSIVLGNILRDGHILKEDDVQELLAQLDLGNVEHNHQNDVSDHHSHKDKPSNANIHHEALHIKERSNDQLSPEDRICKCDNTKGCQACKQLRSDRSDSVDQIADMLDHLEEELGLQANENNDDKDELLTSDGTLRCGCSKIGKKYERSDDTLRCKGNRCGGKKDRKDWKVNSNLRCRDTICDIGDNREDNEVSDLARAVRCIGDRCGRDEDIMDVVMQRINKNYDSEDDSKFSLRCKDDRCGINGQSNTQYSSYKDDLRCGGHKCGSTRLLNKLRCRGPNCNEAFKNDPYQQVKKFKINDNLDAMVMDITQLDKLLNNLDTAMTDVKVLDMDNSGNFNTNNIIEENVDQKLKAIVVDLSKVRNAKSIVKRVEDLMHSKSNNNLISDDYVYNDMNRVADLFAGNQKRLNEVQKLATPKDQALDVPTLIDDKDRNVMNLLHKALGKFNLRGGGHIVMKPVTENAKVTRKLEKQGLLPMTVQQKARLMQKLQSKELETPRPMRALRVSARDIGFPFELAVQALGQVNLGQQ